MIELLSRLASGQTLTSEEARAAVTQIIEGGVSEARIAAFLTALRVRGETVDELVGGAQAMRDQLLPLKTNRKGLLDTCGTGGDLAGTFNISTATAIVASAAGAPVAKHGNRASSSPSGSADVLAALGVNLDADVDCVRRCIETIGIGFLFAPQWHPAMKFAAPVRRDLKFRTLFNYLGPLTNPAGAEYQLVGVHHPDWADRLGQALLRLGVKSATVVAGHDGLDEVTLATQTRAVCVENGSIRIETWTPNTFGLPSASIESLKASSPAESADVIRDLFTGQPGPARAIVLANAAAALRAAHLVGDLREGVEVAAKAVDTGAASLKLDQLIRMTNAPAEATA